MCIRDSLSPLLAQLLLDGESPGFFGILPVELAAGFVVQFQGFCAPAEVGLPALGDRFQPCLLYTSDAADE